MTAFPSQPFVPLAAASVATGRREDFRVLVAEHPERARPLSKMEPGVTPDLSDHHLPQPCEPRVTLQREGDRITGIQIQCSCGQVIDLKCAYPDPSSPPAKS